ncbi:hypothetical protein [Vineibacter terrae]|uniref:hypothetical protein n=1 Tax=Vineibacter terrae TaxID=2586908 RepID=UPI002E37D7D9|nr:hypothetical protein [Vineibacter terrae]HEX2886378.1 hypothetical protein [Vineibacter terrae]
MVAGASRRCGPEARAPGASLRSGQQRRFNQIEERSKDVEKACFDLDIVEKNPVITLAILDRQGLALAV